MENSIGVVRALDPEWQELISMARKQGLSVEEIRSFLWQGEKRDSHMEFEKRDSHMEFEADHVVQFMGS
ncbi:anti-repressor SinI family protein [Paenibacillus spongiae]|uniref:Anti-repressor SinI family protein n=1 Tax=Paenibacillus spongiae TaxID=2909671 RepID=A0ABY5SFM1_9BACL|nr:anti-repressor SinI family protein [Paenibacillus spongiae]UVI31510.1 anti-repressor SinI family protein [Paenibacillus spongiae]